MLYDLDKNINYLNKKSIESSEVAQELINRQGMIV